jgi:hypothetical protein
MPPFRLLAPLSALAAVCSMPLAAADAPTVAYPEGWRQWTHVKSMQILPGHPLYDAFGGLHHLYANPKAIAGYKDGRFSDGAVVVFDLHEAKTEGNAMTAGARKVLGVMHKDARRFAATGGWGFEAFKGDSKTDRAVGANAKAACFECHAPQKQHDYVFSRFER